LAGADLQVRKTKNHLDNRGMLQLSTSNLLKTQRYAD